MQAGPVRQTQQELIQNLKNVRKEVDGNTQNINDMQKQITPPANGMNSITVINFVLLTFCRILYKSYEYISVTVANNEKSHKNIFVNHLCFLKQSQFNKLSISGDDQFSGTFRLWPMNGELGHSLK